MEKLSPSALFFAGVQWLFFMFANTVVVPLSVGAAFQLSPQEITTSVQYSFLLTGIACILQAFVGHRYSLLEGQSGVWWGVILGLCVSAHSVGLSVMQVGGGLASGIMLSGLATVLLGAFGLGKLLKKLFTPVAMAVYLFLLSCQLILIFFKGMLGLSGDNHLNVSVALLSLCLVVLVGWLSLKGRGLISNFALLIGIVVGWVAYSFLFPAEKVMQVPALHLPTLFPWGAPNWEMGIIFTAFLTGMINTSNTVTAVSSVERLYGTVTKPEQYRGSFLLTGGGAILSAMLGLVPSAPYASSIGFLESTRILQKSAFILGAVMFGMLGIIPVLSAFFSTMPISVGNAVLFVAYLQLFGTALRTIDGITFNSRTIYRIALPTLLGICIMNMSPDVFTSLPILIRPLVSSGLLVGVIVSLLLEHSINWAALEQPQGTEKTADSMTSQRRSS